jgi:hypothetical protein
MKEIPDGFSYCARHNELSAVAAGEECGRCHADFLSRYDRPSVIRPSPQATRAFGMIADASLLIHKYTLGGIRRVVLTNKGGRMFGLEPTIGCSAMTIHTPTGVVEISVEIES